MKTDTWFLDRIGMTILADGEPMKLKNEEQAAWMLFAQAHGHRFEDVPARPAPNVCIACES